MLPAEFCKINSYFDGNLNGWVNYRANTTYVLRFYVDRWEANGPPVAGRDELIKTLGKMLIMHNEVGGYDLKAVLFQKIPKGNKVEYYQPHWYSTNLGSSGCNESFTASETTWGVDIVFTTLNDTESSWSQVQEWQEYLSRAMISGMGVPNVYIAGLLELAEGSGTPSGTNAGYDAARSFWPNVPGYYQMRRIPDANQNKGVTADIQQINKTTVWIDLNKRGKDGVGFAKGSAFDPVKLEPWTISGTIVPGPGSGPGPQPGGSDPANPGSKTLTTGEKVIATAAGAAVMYYLYKRFVEGR